MKLAERADRVVLGIQRERWRVLRIRVAVRVASVFFLDAGRIGQHERTELARRWCAEDAAAKPVCDEPRQISAVIEMRVGENDRVNSRRIDRQRCPVALAQLLQALKEAAVDEHAMIAEVEQVLGPGHRARSPEKRECG